MNEWCFVKGYVKFSLKIIFIETVDAYQNFANNVTSAKLEIVTN